MNVTEWKGSLQRHMTTKINEEKEAICLKMKQFFSRFQAAGKSANHLQRVWTMPCLFCVCLNECGVEYILSKKDVVTANQLYPPSLFLCPCVFENRSFSIFPSYFFELKNVTSHDLISKNFFSLNIHHYEMGKSIKTRYIFFITFVHPV